MGTLRHGFATRAADAPPAPVGPPFLASTRASAWLLLVLAVLNGLFLYVLPSQAATDYAWPIVPEVNAAVLGAGYLAGVLAVTGALLAGRWRAFQVLAPALMVLSVTELLATILHEDRFKWDYLPTIGWTVVYAGAPAAVALVWWREARRIEDPGPREAQLRPFRAPVLVTGAVLAAIAVVCFVAPDTAVDRWPWEITPLLARAFAGWYALAATTLVFGILTARRRSELAIGAATVAAWSALLLVAALLHGAGGGGAMVAWSTLHVAVLAVCSWLAAAGWRGVR